MGKCKVKDGWLKTTDQNGYCVGSWARKAGERELFCVVCDSVINVDHGYCRVMQHSRMKNHVANCKAKLAPLQLRLQRCDVNVQSGPSASSMITPSTNNFVAGQPKSSVQLKLSCGEDKQKAMRAELVWTLKSVLAHNSLNSNSDITEVFRTMFGSLVPDDFSLSPSKMMYLITEALGPYFWEKTVSEAQGSFYSICFDETTNESSQKELQIAVRCWSQAERKVVDRHLQTFFIGRAKAEDLHKKILLAIDNASLPLKNILMISCDGPNVNKKVIRLMNESVLEIRNKGLVNTGTCSLHKVHNAFLKGLHELGHDVSDLIISVFHYFDGWPARWESYEEIQCKLRIANYRFIKHVPSRWLTIGPACERFLEQWDALVHYFLKHIPRYSAKEIDSGRYKAIVHLLKEPNMKAQIIFVIEAVKLFTTYSKYFQVEGPMIQCLYDKGKELLLKLRSKVYKPEVVENFSEDCGSDFEKLLPLKEICLNEELSKELKTLKEKDAQLFLFRFQKYYVVSAKYLANGLNLDKEGNILKDARCLRIHNFKLPSSDSQIVVLGKSLPLDVDISLLQDEWKILKFEGNLPGEKVSFEEYWCHLFTLESSPNVAKYPTVTKVVKAALSLSHGSASIERGFSTSGLVLTSDRVAINERGLNARLNILSGMKRYLNKVSLVPITPELLVMARNAYRSYKTYLEEDKINKERLAKESERKGSEKIALKQRAEVAQDLEKLSKDLIEKNKQESKKKDAADKLFDEATKRLASAVKRKNYEELSLAQGMLYGVKALRKNEAEVSEEVVSIAKVIEKKSSKISAYFKKLPKN